MRVTLRSGPLGWGRTGPRVGRFIFACLGAGCAAGLGPRESRPQPTFPPAALRGLPGSAVLSGCRAPAPGNADAPLSSPHFPPGSTLVCRRGRGERWRLHLRPGGPGRALGQRTEKAARSRGRGGSASPDEFGGVGEGAKVTEGARVAGSPWTLGGLLGASQIPWHSSSW